MKRLRKSHDGVDYVKSHKGDHLIKPIRYYMCGEYGENFGRPHYHALLFNFDFSDKYHYINTSKSKILRSPMLEKLWTKGMSSVGDCNYASALYVARYVMKKKFGEESFIHYNNVCEYTGELLSTKLPEYNDMSRRPGIAKAWFDLYGDQVYPRDEVIIKGKRVKPPKYYDRQYELLYPEEMEMIKQKRLDKFALYESDNTFERLAVREKVYELNLQLKQQRVLK